MKRITSIRDKHRLEIAELALIALGFIAYFVLPGGVGYGDAFFRFGTLEALMSGHISSTRYSILQAIVAAPFYMIGELIDYPLGVVARFNRTVFLAGLVAIAWLLAGRVPVTLLRRLGLLLLAASLFGNHVQAFYGETLTAVCVAVGLLCLTVGRRVPAYLLLIVGVANTPATLPALFLALISHEGRRRLWHAAWPTLAAGALVLVEFYVRRGDPFLSGYEGDHGPVTPMPYSGREGFSHPLVFGVLAILFSFGKGLALFVPGLWLLLKRPVAAPAAALVAFQRPAIWFLVGLVVVYAKWWAWNGAWFWGPRFFLFACFPASVALAVHLCDAHASTRAKALTLTVLGWSTWVAVNGVAIGLDGLDVCTYNGYYLEALCWYTVELSPLFHPFIVAPALHVRETIVAIYFIAVGVVLAAPFALDLLREGASHLTTLRVRQNS